MAEARHASGIVLLAGGVGGARMARGLAAALPPGALTVVGNIGDDDDFYGLRVSPDLDTILYTLAGVVDRAQGWGVDGDGARALGRLEALGAPSWMKLGDADFGLHIYRSWRLTQGASLTEVMREAAQGMGVRTRLLPASDLPCPTRVDTGEGRLSFQEWFVRERAEPAVKGLQYGDGGCVPASAAAVEAIRAAEGIIIAPSNPLLSILPILSLAGMRDALARTRAPCLAVSPLINGRAVKGPLARMLRDLGMNGGNGGIAQLYGDVIDAMVIDTSDAEDGQVLRGKGLDVLAFNTLISGTAPALALARRILDWMPRLARRKEAA